MTLYEQLAACGSEQYRDFQSKLVPNIPKQTILGVKTPELRRIAKQLQGTAEAEAFLAALPHEYYEENLVHFFLIAMIRDFDACVRAVETFLPYVDCWPVCDQSSPKAFAYTAPISALIHLCDREPEKTADAIAQIEAFSRHFVKVYGSLS